jgi:hypothetical protein
MITPLPPLPLHLIDPVVDPVAAATKGVAAVRWRNFARVACPLLPPPPPMCRISGWYPSCLLADCCARHSDRRPSERRPSDRRPSDPAPLTTAPLTTAPLTAAPFTAAPLTAAPLNAAPLTATSDSRPSDRHPSDRRAAPLTAVPRLCPEVFPVAASRFKLPDKLKTLYLCREGFIFLPCNN